MRDYTAEHAARVEAERAREAAGRMRQCNEGRLEFSMVEEDGAGNCVLSVGVPRFLDTSLVDVDVHPMYVTVVLKSKARGALAAWAVRATDGHARAADAAPRVARGGRR